MANWYKNKVILYVASRYFTYGLQFISLLILSEKLGPFDYGIWGFILMLISYMQIINLGIANSTNVIIIQYKNNVEKVRNYIASSFGAAMILLSGLIIFGFIYYLKPDLFNKYQLGSLFYLILIIGAFQYINTIFSNIYRARNNIFEVAFYQSSVPIIIFFIIIFSSKKHIINMLVYGYLCANIISFLLFIIRKKYPNGGKVKIGYIRDIIGKGFFLFLYNSAFYLILTTSSSFVSKNYSIEEFGMFSFSYTLGHSILLLMEAFAFIVYPKVIDKLYTGDIVSIEKTLKSVRNNYVMLSHGLMYIVIAILPYFIKLFPKFENSLLMLELMILSIILSTNSFGYNTLLIAKNHEKLSATISLISLIVNIVLCFVIINVLHLPYYFAITSVLISYGIFALLCSWFSHKFLYNNTRGFLSAVFPLNLITPYILTIFIIFTNYNILLWVPLLLFTILNRKVLAEITLTIKRILNRPQLINVNATEEEI